MKFSAIVRGGIWAGIVTAIVVAAAGKLLELNLPPWSWTSTRIGWLGYAIELFRAIALVLPVALAWTLALAFMAALVFEYVTQRTNRLLGAVVGSIFGIVTASALGLIPWATFWFSYAYMPANAPLGTEGASWAYVVLIAAGTISGRIVAVIYGRPRHASDERLPVRWRQIFPR